MAVCQGSSAWDGTRLKTELSRVQVPPQALVFANKIENNNILIEDIILFSDFLMKSNKTITKSKKTGKKSTKKKTKKSADSADDPGIILIDDDLEVDAEKELEERKVFLEEARSQDTAD